VTKKFFLRDYFFLILVVIYELILLLVIGKIELWSTCGFLILYAIFIFAVVFIKSDDEQNEELQDVSRKASVFIDEVENLRKKGNKGSVAGSAGTNNKWENTRGLLRMNHKKKIDFDDVDDVDTSKKTKKKTAN